MYKSRPVHVNASRSTYFGTVAQNVSRKHTCNNDFFGNTNLSMNRSKISNIFVLYVYKALQVYMLTVRIHKGKVIQDFKFFKSEL